MTPSPLLGELFLRELGETSATVFLTRPRAECD